MTGPGPATGGHVDLHAHSTASDGTAPPADVIAAAAAAGLTAIALTDHDTVAGLAEARRAADSLAIRVVAGVELSAVEGEDEVHLLGLHLDRPAEVQRDLEALRAARRERAERMVARLNELGIPVTLDAVLEAAGAGAVGRPHVARALVAGGWVRDQREAFGRYIGAGRPGFVPKRRFTAEEAVALVHRAGGIAVFAHPGAAGTRPRLEELARAGLDGVEVLHPSHPADDIARLGALAAELGLVRSGGSDWHGAQNGPRTLGCMRVPPEWLEEQDARVQLVRERAA